MGRKAYCCWCEKNPNPTEANPKNGLTWIHLSCFLRFYHTLAYLEGVKKRLEKGESFEDIARYLSRLDEHEKKLDNILQMIYGDVMPPVIESEDCRTSR